MKSIICKSCNSIVAEGARFCLICGKEVAVRVCPGCGTEVPEGARFCMGCGQEIGIHTCVACGAKAPRNVRFCTNCGKEMINQLSTQTMATTPHIESAPHPPDPLLAKALVPATVTKQEPLPRGKKRHIGLAIFIIVLLIGSIVVAIIFMRNFNRQVALEENGALLAEENGALLTEENGALWAKANTALATFVGDNLAQFAVAKFSPITPEEIDQVTQQISAFDKALKALEVVKPPSDQVIIQEMLLPMYRGIYAQMVTIKDALVTGDRLKIDFEVQRLQLLLDELGGALDMLTLETAPAQPTGF